MDEVMRKMFATELARSGGKAAADKLTPRQRKAKARKAAKTRWDKVRASKAQGAASVSLEEVAGAKVKLKGAE